MAACGLDPGRRDSVNSVNRDSYSDHVVLVLTRFAANMMGVLQKINKEFLQNFKLRVGQFQMHATFITACPESHSRILGGHIVTAIHIEGKTELK